MLPKDSIIQFPVDHQAIVTNSVSLRVDTLMPLKYLFPWMSNPPAYMDAYGYMQSISGTSLTMTVQLLLISPLAFGH